MSSVEEVERMAIRVFTEADTDGNGWLSHTELKRLLHKKDELRTALRVAGGRPWKDFWAELDANKDGKIKLDELLDYLRKEVKAEAQLKAQDNAAAVAARLAEEKAKEKEAAAAAAAASAPETATPKRVSYASVAAGRSEESPAVRFTPKPRQATPAPLPISSDAPAKSSTADPLQIASIVALAGFIVYRVMQKA